MSIAARRFVGFVARAATPASGSRLLALSRDQLIDSAPRAERCSVANQVAETSGYVVRARAGMRTNGNNDRRQDQTGNGARSNGLNNRRPNEKPHGNNGKRNGKRSRIF